MSRTVRAVLHAALAEDADLYHFHDPELIPVGLWLKARGKRVLYDVHEHVPQQIRAKTWISPWLRRPMSAGMVAIEGGSTRLFDGVVAATPTIASRFPADKTVTVQNFPIVGEFRQRAGVPYRQRAATVAYVGGLTAQRGAWEMVRAMGCLPEGLGARLQLAGAFQPEQLQGELEAAPAWPLVDCAGWLSRGEVADFLGRARIGMVTLHPLPNYQDAYPIKLFEYMAAGIPVVASDFPLWRRIVEDAGCGLLADPLDPNAIAAAIQWLLEHEDEAEAMGRRGQRAVIEQYNWDVEAKKLLDFYHSLLGLECVPQF